MVKDIKQDVLDSLRGVFANYAPEFVYLKTLHHLFAADLSRKTDQPFEQLGILETQTWRTLFEFQRDGAKAAIQKLNDLNGCVLADSVGLGKTYTALAVIKYFELRGLQVLVLCPKKLRENWTTYVATNASDLNPFIADKYGYTVLSHTDLSREGGKTGDIDLASINWGAYDLVVIDRSPQLPEQRQRAAGTENRWSSEKAAMKRLMEDILSGRVSNQGVATVGHGRNDLKDLRSQI